MRPVFTVDGLLLARDGANHGWKVARETGWYSSAPARADVQARQGAHGGIDAPTWRAPRVVTLGGLGRWASRRDALAAARVLAGLDPSPGVLSVSDDLGTLVASVRIASEPTIAWVTDTACTWDMALAAPDHRKHGPAVTTQAPLPRDTPTGLPFDPSASAGPSFDFGEAPTLGVLTATNPGTTASDPVITLDGGSTGLVGPIEVVQWSTGSLLRYSGDVDPGRRVILTAADRSVLLDATVNRRELLTSAQWWQVPAMGEVVVSWSHSGAESLGARLSVAVAPAYL